MSVSKQKLKINFFGELWKLSKIEFAPEEIEALKAYSSKFEISKSEALLDVNFFSFLKTRGISFYEDFENTSISGLLNYGKSQIEIWYAHKKIKKIKLSDLNNEQLLFPLFKIEKSLLNYNSLPNGLFVEQKEKGLIASFEMLLPCFSIDLLSYSFVEVLKKDSKFQILHQIKYDDVILQKSSRTDTLITYIHSFEI